MPFFTFARLYVILAASLSIAGCSSEPDILTSGPSVANHAEITPSQLAEAKAWYEQAYAAAKRPLRLDWAAAQNFTNTIVVPLREPEDNFAGTNHTGYRRLLLTQTATTWRGVIVELHAAGTVLPTTTIPALLCEAYFNYQQATMNRLQAYTGLVLVYSPTYVYEGGLSYTKGIPAAQPVVLSLKEHYKPATSTTENDSGAVTNQYSPPMCITTYTDWYIDGVYQYTTQGSTECTSGGDDGSSGGTGGGGGTGDSDTGGGGYGGGGHGGGATPPASAPTSIIINQSIHDDPKAECVLTKLQNNSQFNQLLKSFQNSSQYNVSFNMGSLSNNVGGQSVWNQNNSTSVITIDKSLFDYQHAIWGATTFFHEAYHAQLQQFAISTFGTLTIANWPKQINDMTLQELISCVDITASSNPNWTNASHQFMAYNNGVMAEGLRSFVQTNYPLTYNQIGADMNKYNYLSLMGLENTTQYQTEIIDQGKKDLFQQAINDFVTNERPDCL